ncbi:hypothetical protein GCM10012285_13110 [Streptomyces kronopolitis]|uniref:Uncharacterized protein n=1 Tax=Streptomyces kronopolitis TaxID=1612435 RepID=A0ABQ2J4X5_9ACTN|nr:hypothetical protein GCM10012285_13110 [Streptomyces kronopolitis]
MCRRAERGLEDAEFDTVDMHALEFADDTFDGDRVHWCGMWADRILDSAIADRLSRDASPPRTTCAAFPPPGAPGPPTRSAGSAACTVRSSAGPDRTSRPVPGQAGHRTMCKPPASPRTRSPRGMRSSPQQSGLRLYPMG